MQGLHFIFYTLFLLIRLFLVKVLCKVEILMERQNTPFLSILKGRIGLFAFKLTIYFINFISFYQPSLTVFLFW